ncbi:MAG: DUF2064 domain-containing protein [Phycisphaerales bacterium]
MTAVLMAKRPDPGAVKTRLIGDRFDDHDAAALSTAMMRCVATRLGEIFDTVILAVSPDDAGALDLEPDDTIPQGDGDLGARLTRVWETVRDRRGAGPVAFFGVDSPDAPRAELLTLRRYFRTDTAPIDVAIGPTFDGGYWTIASRRFEPSLFEGIEWGGPTVCAATKARAVAANRRVATLSRWYDVDEPPEVDALVDRLAHATEPALVRLRSDLAAIVRRRPKD